MALQIPVATSGSPGSPYTPRMLTLLRYRRIPHRFLHPNSPAAQAMPQPRVRLTPTLYLPETSPHVAPLLEQTGPAAMFS